MKNWEYFETRFTFDKKRDVVWKCITKYLQRYIGKESRVLDVGAGFGLFSSILQNLGNFKLEIIEPRQILQFNIKLEQKSHNTTFEKFNSKSKKYDLIILLDVIEHFKNPISNLKKARGMLKKNGILVIQTPNYKSLMAGICRDWAWWMIEEHKYFFSPKSILKILTKTGFEQKFLKTYEDLPDFKKNLDGNFTLISSLFLRKIVKTLFYLIFFPLYLISRKLLWKFNYGGVIFVKVKKD